MNINFIIMALQVKIKALKHYQHAKSMRAPGDVYSVDQDTAKALIKNGKAEAYKEASKPASPSA